MKLTSVISNYDPAWPQQYEAEAERLRPVFGVTLLEMHHIASTAVPGLSAKPEIDILIVVSDDGDVEYWSSLLAPMGYRRGGNLSDGHYFYKRDVCQVRTHKLHVCILGHPEIGRMLIFRDLLRNNDDIRIAYQELKLNLEPTNTMGIGEYLQKKAPFIESMISRKAKINTSTSA